MLFEISQVTQSLLDAATALAVNHPLVSDIVAQHSSNIQEGANTTTTSRSLVVISLLPPCSSVWEEEFEGPADKPDGEDNTTDDRPSIREESASPSLFRIVRELGTGSVGTVLLAQLLRHPWAFYALKRFTGGGGRSNVWRTDQAEGVHSTCPRRTDGNELDGSGSEDDESAEAQPLGTLARELHVIEALLQRSKGVPHGTATPSTPLLHDGQRHLARYVGLYHTRHARHLVMELASLGSMASSLHHPSSVLSLDPLVATKFLLHALRGLEWLHARGVMHRDIKPANMLLRGSHLSSLSDAELFLADFGISKVLLRSSPALSSSLALQQSRCGSAAWHCDTLSSGCCTAAGGTQQRQEQQHTVAGTLGYCAPEVLQQWGLSTASAYSAKADVFSLGAVFYCLLARDDACVGLVRGPHDMDRVLRGELPLLQDLRCIGEAEEIVADDEPVDDATRNAFLAGDYQESATSYFETADVLRRQALQNRAEGLRLLKYPLPLLVFIDQLMCVDPKKRPSSHQALAILTTLLLTLSSSRGPLESTIPLAVVDGYGSEQRGNLWSCIGCSLPLTGRRDESGRGERAVQTIRVSMAGTGPLVRCCLTLRGEDDAIITDAQGHRILGGVCMFVTDEVNRYFGRLNPIAIHVTSDVAVSCKSSSDNNGMVDSDYGTDDVDGVGMTSTATLTWWRCPPLPKFHVVEAVSRGVMQFVNATRCK